MRSGFSVPELLWNWPQFRAWGPAMDSGSPPRPPLDGEPAFEIFSGAMRDVVAQADRAARFDSTILITGESGVGKERLARYVHHRSPRATGPFVAANCGAFVEGLIESELFGHVRGAFTGAARDHAGLFEQANGGTLLLDEIGDLSPPLQVRLLRVLQEREVRRVGDIRTRRVDVRVIAATNHNLKEAAETGRFRRDLYYRLEVIELEIPPLRQRPEDVEGLARALLRRIAHRMGATITGYTAAALMHIRQYDWPGNVRELENVIERACALAVDSLIDVSDLPRELRLCAAPGLARVADIRPLPDLEREHILDTLRRNGGNKTETARQLKIARATLFRKLRLYAIAS